jgi:hypothetical protein
MNPDNYGTLEPCQALVKAGIVMETEKTWYFFSGDMKYALRETGDCRWTGIPAPSMAEVLDHLKSNDLFDDAMMKHFTSLQLMKLGQPVHVEYILKDLADLTTDALIYLRIWLEERKGEKG